jgi:WD40 repeat protein
VAIKGPGGEAFVNTSPVSKVKYSQSGHLLAVITGRLGQVFNMYDLCYPSGDILGGKNDPSNSHSNNSLLAGSPTRVMVMTDHSAQINDVIFSKDDKRLFTCSGKKSMTIGMLHLLNYLMCRRWCYL